MRDPVPKVGFGREVRREKRLRVVELHKRCKLNQRAPPIQSLDEIVQVPKRIFEHPSYTESIFAVADITALSALHFAKLSDWGKVEP